MAEMLAAKVAVVTGAANGIGRALSEAFVNEGMQVVLADVDQQALETTSAALADAGGSVLAVPVDVADPSAVDALAERTWETFGGAHLLCNNAGVIGPRDRFIWDIEPDQWQRVFAVNVLGVLNGIRAFVPRMATLDTVCHVVNTASMMGWIARAPVAAQYSASKHAVVSLSESLAYEAAIHHPWLRVSVLCPGPVDSGFRQRNEALGFTTAGEAKLDESEWSNDERRVALTPEAVAADVVRAVRAGRLYIFPNPGTRDRLAAQFDTVLDAAVL